MTKKYLLALFMVVVIVGIAFGQDGTQESNGRAVNTITLDVAPVIIGLAVPEIIRSFGGDDVSGTYCFGFGIQYERNIDNQISLAWRLDYLGFGSGLNLSFDNAAINNINVSKITFENQFRYYPFSGTFFLGGLIGYTYLNMDLSGSATVTDPLGGVHSGASSFIVERHSIKFGARAGWRIRFGQNRGFTLEPSIGYDVGISFGDTVTNQFKKGIFGTSNIPMSGLEDFEEIFHLFEALILAGGPRFTLSLGWSF